MSLKVLHQQTGSVTRLGDLLDNFLEPLTITNLPKLLPFVGNYSIGIISYLFLEKSFYDNFYRHLAYVSGHAASR